ncbi:PREDICTED: protein cramped [Nicrophorus vespilloides]|uniref:Protein cramped n=1 Tax=Nicrophorus vespilloides TaxID=110193 RepID=A0ABM1NAB2_NICVS|nr:PREDICTED: protein cramped [Nicrophorus vespilloides]
MNTPEVSKKVLIDPSIPIEELLGSVTTYNSVGSEMKSLQLRTSARVFKKMKLDSELAALGPTDKKEEKKEDTKKEEMKPEMKKPPLRGPLWSHEDKTLFFEALNEYGKDFDAIHTSISNKLKKRGVPEYMIKTREQVRHLYYRIWHKASKHLKFSSDVKKLAQELYCLINFGELRKKLTLISEKTSIRLNELIYRGSLNMRVKGKTIRIRTPMCKALRRLNQLDENGGDELIKLPNRICIELKPKDMHTWMKVQEMSQNPRVKTIMPLQKRLGTIFTHLTERWKTQEVYEHEKLLAEAESIPLDDPSDKILENTKPRTDPFLRFQPPSDVNITIPTISVTEYMTTENICLNAYEERIGAKTSGEKLWLDAYPSFKNALSRGSLRRGVKRCRTNSVNEKQIPKSSSSIIDNNENCLVENELPGAKVNDLIDEAVNTILALQNPAENMEIVEEKKPDDIKMEEDCLLQVKKEHDIAKIKLGWTMEDCGTLTVGDLYLMFGSDSMVCLVYSWDEQEGIQLIKEEESINETVDNETVIESDNSDNCNNYERLNHKPDELSVTLKRLLSIAKLHYRKNIVKCPCGHVCGAPNKGNGTKTKPTVRKNPVVNTESSTQRIEPPKIVQTTTVINLQPSNVTTTASMVPIIIQPKKFPPTIFRRPISPNDNLRAQIDSIQKLRPRYCNRKGRRPRSKQVVVERKLPLLANKADSGRQIVQMNIISQDITMPRQIAPKIVPQIENSVLLNECNSTFVEATLTPVAVTSNQITGTYAISSLEENNINSEHIMDNATTPSRVGSPTSISNLLDLALQSHVSNGGVKENITSFVGILSENNIATSTPPTSPSRILKENENQWLNSEVADFSFSSFLGHLESPMKATQSTSTITNDDSRLGLTQDVDAQLQSLLTESSLDYTAKFADLAAQMTDSKK